VSTRTRLMLALAGLLALAVAVDQLLLKGGGEDDAASGAPSASSSYRQAAERLATKRAMIEARADYERLLEDAREKWGRARGRMIQAETGQVAVALLGDRVRRLAEEYRPAGYSAQRGDARAIEGAPGVYELEVSVSMDLASAADAFALLDRLENMPGLAANIESVRLDGPGRLGSRSVTPLSLSLTLQALAVVGEEG
jgi:hypothetical protein